jgi:MFS family permease
VGKIYTYFNVKWTFLIALLIFEVGSIICAVAPSSKVLILGRAVAGVGAAGYVEPGPKSTAYTDGSQHLFRNFDNHRIFCPA